MGGASVVLFLILCHDLSKKLAQYTFGGQNIDEPRKNNNFGFKSFKIIFMSGAFPKVLHIRYNLTGLNLEAAENPQYVFLLLGSAPVKE